MAFLCRLLMRAIQMPSQRATDLLNILSIFQQRHRHHYDNFFLSSPLWSPHNTITTENRGISGFTNIGLIAGTCHKPYVSI
jgi:hypothetical protein